MGVKYPVSVSWHDYKYVREATIARSRYGYDFNEVIDDMSNWTERYNNEILDYRKYPFPKPATISINISWMDSYLDSDSYKDWNTNKIENLPFIYYAISKFKPTSRLNNDTISLSLLKYATSNKRFSMSSDDASSIMSDLLALIQNYEKSVYVTSEKNMIVRFKLWLVNNDLEIGDNDDENKKLFEQFKINDIDTINKMMSRVNKRKKSKNNKVMDS